jgi:Histidinol phosphatase and related hydrolases of the PHP family
MIDLHTHTLLSDGVLLPSELIRRAEAIGYRVIGITDHVDKANIDHVLPRIKNVCLDLMPKVGIRVIPGVELTHIPPEDFPEMVRYARENGACVVVGHGETIVEPVKPGTNRAAIEAGVDILAHPGYISEEDALSARERGVYLEISARKGHCLCNGHVAKMALRVGARLVLDTDTHTPDNLITREMSERIARGAGLEPAQIQQVLRQGTELLVERLLARVKVLSVI